MSRVVILVGSVRKGGNTELLAGAFAEGARLHNEVKLFPWLITVSIHVQGVTAVFLMKIMSVSRMTIWR